MRELRLGADDRELSLRIRGYQFDDADGECDADWLVVELSLQVGARRFERADPCLETHDLARLAGWLEQAAAHASTFEAWRGPALTTRRSFTEPCLEFEVRSGSPVILRVLLSHELLPPFAGELPHVVRHDRDDEDGSAPTPCQAWLDVPVGRAGLLAAAATVREWASAWPVRGRTAGGG